MKLVRYGQAAIIAAILSLTGNAVWAQQPCPQKDCGIYNRISEVLSSIPCEIKVKCYVSKDCCASGACCKEGKCCSSYKPYDAKCSCCKDGQCCKAEDCCASQKCDSKCSCCKDSKCSCCKDGECACDKNGKCSCGKDKTSATKTGCDCCPFMSNLTKRTAIIMVMPASMPLPPCCMEAMGMLPHPPMPPGPHVFLPPMMPPMPPIPPTPSMGIGMPVAMPPMPAVCAPCPDVNTSWATGTRIVAPCPTAKGLTIAAPGYFCTSTADAKVRQETAEKNEQLVMFVGDATCISAKKKMTITIGDTKLTLSRFDNRVRIRGEELKATATCVRSDCKDRLILEGNVVLHYKKDGHTAHVTGECIELDLSNGTMAIHKAEKPATIGYYGGAYESK